MLKNTGQRTLGKTGVKEDAKDAQKYKNLCVSKNSGIFQAGE